MGADKLLGKGDMLYLPPGSAKLIRAQGALITDQEIQSIVDFIAKQGKPSYEVEIHQQLSKPVSSFDSEERHAMKTKTSSSNASKSSAANKKPASRSCNAGFASATPAPPASWTNSENRGIVGPSKGAEPRDILIDLDGDRRGCPRSAFDLMLLR